MTYDRFVTTTIYHENFYFIAMILMYMPPKILNRADADNLRRALVATKFIINVFSYKKTSFKFLAAYD